MKYQILVVGLKRTLLSWYERFFSEKDVALRTAEGFREVSSILKSETIHLLVLDMRYLRNIGQSDRIVNIRYVSFLPIIVLSDAPDADTASAIEAGADACYDNNLPPFVIAPLLYAQLRRYTEYNHFDEPETASFQIGDVAIDPCRRLVWVRGGEVELRPREFNLLLYFMQNPGVVLTAEQISQHLWGVVESYSRISHPIYLLRHAIEPDPANPIYIKTKYRVGYSFMEP